MPSSRTPTLELGRARRVLRGRWFRGCGSVLLASALVAVPAHAVEPLEDEELAEGQDEQPPPAPSAPIVQQPQLGPAVAPNIPPAAEPGNPNIQPRSDLPPREPEMLPPAPPPAEPPLPPLEPKHKPERVQLGLQFGYMFGSSVSAVQGDLDVAGNLSYGALVDFVLRPGLLAELSYTWVPTHLDLDQNFDGKIRLTDLDLHFFEAGIQGEFLPGQVRPFLEFLLGATLLHPHNQLDDEWRFSTVIGGGVKYLPTPKFGLRAQARLLSTFAGTDTGIFCGFGGCVSGVFGDGLFQFELTGGVFAAF